MWTNCTQFGILKLTKYFKLNINKNVTTAHSLQTSKSGIGRGHCGLELV